MLPAARYREMLVEEDAGDGCRVFVPLPPDEPYEDVMDHALPMEATYPHWHCDGCGQRMSGLDFACGYCGVTREDMGDLP